MRKTLVSLIAIMAVALASIGASATVPGEFTLSLGGGYPLTLGELELEYKNGPWAGGIHTTFVGTGMDIGLFGRYYVPLGKGFNFYAALNPSMVVLFAGGVRGIIKAGPGFDYRWKHLRVGIEGGIFYIFGATTPMGYGKASIGYIF